MPGTNRACYGLTRGFKPPISAETAARGAANVYVEAVFRLYFLGFHSLTKASLATN
jgi:hypothetical protein